MWFIAFPSIPGLVLSGDPQDSLQSSGMYPHGTAKIGQHISQYSVLGLGRNSQESCRNMGGTIKPSSCMPSGHYLEPAAPSKQGSSADAWFIGKNNISEKLWEHLVEELNINPLCTDCLKTWLWFAWGCYLECSGAIKHANEMTEAGTWPTDIQNYIKIFEPVDTISAFSNMKA